MVCLTAALVSSIQDGADLVTLTSINVGRRGIDQITGLDVCQRLTKLNLSDNRLSSLEGLTLCANLTWLSVAGNHLTNLKGIGKLTKLTVLNASKNELTCVSEVSLLTNLRALILNDNEITVLPKLDSLVNLNTIVVSRNPVQSMGSFASKVSSLKKLLDTSIKLCTAIEELRLAQNRLSTLPQELESNGKLTILDLGTNHFKDWSSIQVLENLHSLANLNLRGNPVSAQDGYNDLVRSKLPNLQVLDGQNLQAVVKKRKSKKNVENDHCKEREIESPGLAGAKSETIDEKTENGDVDSWNSKSFFEKIGLQVDKKKELPVRSTKRRKEDSGVVSVEDSRRGRSRHLNTREANHGCAELPSVEIGTGGPSTWDVESRDSSTEARAIESSGTGQLPVKVECKPYTRWVLKNS